MDGHVFFEILTGKKGTPVVIPAAIIVIKIFEKYGNSLQKDFRNHTIILRLRKLLKSPKLKEKLFFLERKEGRKRKKL